MTKDDSLDKPALRLLEVVFKKCYTELQGHSYLPEHINGPDGDTQDTDIQTFIKGLGDSPSKGEQFFNLIKHVENLYKSAIDQCQNSMPEKNSSVINALFRPFEKDDTQFQKVCLEKLAFMQNLYKQIKQLAPIQVDQKDESKEK